MHRKAQSCRSAALSFPQVMIFTLRPTFLFRPAAKACLYH
nr:MAG TPA: hypothetical protein [Caudoviricetes sp.]